MAITYDKWVDHVLDPNMNVLPAARAVLARRTFSTYKNKVFQFYPHDFENVNLKNMIGAGNAFMAIKRYMDAATTCP